MMRTLFPGKRDSKNRKDRGFLFVDVLVAIIIIEICLGAATGVLVSQTKFLTKTIQINRKIIEKNNQIITEMELVYSKK